jgi:N-methylhydantoinase B
MYGNWGARQGLDGIDGASNIFSNMSNIPIEIIESEFPIRIRRYGFLPNSGGAGRFRGGLSMLREFELLSGSATLTVRSDRRRFRPYGLAGGEAGASSRSTLFTSAGSAVDLPTKFTRPLAEGDVFLHVQAGAGGFGDPLLRDPDRIAQDVEDEKIDCAHALEAYGVVVDPTSFRVDLVATERARAERGGRRD